MGEVRRKTWPGEPQRPVRARPRRDRSRELVHERLPAIAEVACRQREIELAAGELDPEELEALYVQLEAYGIEVRDDCGREEPGEVTYANGDLAAATADSLSSFSTRCPATPC